jgi:hypothetical protein
MRAEGERQLEGEVTAAVPEEIVRPATREYHPSRRRRPTPAGGGSRIARAPPRPVKLLRIPQDVDDVELPVSRRRVRLTNLRKVFWPDLGLTKGDLLQYYADVAYVLLPTCAIGRW